MTKKTKTQKQPYPELDYKRFYFSYIDNPELSGDDQIQGDCPFCFKEGHFYGSILTGQCDCKRCGFKGNARTFLRQLERLSKTEINDLLGKFKRLKPIKIKKCSKTIFPQSLVDKYVQNLSEKDQSKFRIERGIWGDCLQQYELGMDEHGRYTLPVRDKEGNIRNIYRKRIGHDTISSKGGENILFASRDFYKESCKAVIVAEGAWSALALISNGFIAVGTAGAGNIKPYEIEYFQGKDVYIVPDNDDAGIEGAKRFARKIYGVAKEIFWISITLQLPPGWDVRQYIKRHGRHRFESHVRKAKKLTPEMIDLKKKR